MLFNDALNHIVQRVGVRVEEILLDCAFDQAVEQVGIKQRVIPPGLDEFLHEERPEARGPFTELLTQYLHHGRL